jgi:hypothetical protein
MYVRVLLHRDTSSLEIDRSLLGGPVSREVDDDLFPQVIEIGDESGGDFGILLRIDLKTVDDQELGRLAMTANEHESERNPSGRCNKSLTSGI